LRIDVGFPLSGLQDRTHTSDLNVRARHTQLHLAYGSAPQPGFPNEAGEFSTGESGPLLDRP
jgi:hypothetical protein